MFQSGGKSECMWKLVWWTTTDIFNHISVYIYMEIGSLERDCLARRQNILLLCDVSWKLIQSRQGIFSYFLCTAVWIQKLLFN